MFLLLLALLISTCSESTLDPVNVVIFPTHIKNDTRMQTRNISAEKMPVRTLKSSVGNLSSFSASVISDCLGMNQMIKRTSKGKIMPPATIILGVAVQSLKKQMMSPIIPKAHTAAVPRPTPITKPLYISAFPLYATLVIVVVESYANVC